MRRQVRAKEGADECLAADQQNHVHVFVVEVSTCFLDGNVRSKRLGAPQHEVHD